MLLTGLLPLAFSASSLPQPKRTCPGVILPTVGWALPHHTTVKKMTTGLSDGDNSSIEVSGSHVTIVCVKSRLADIRMFLPSFLGEPSLEEVGGQNTGLRL